VIHVLNASGASLLLAFKSWSEPPFFNGLVAVGGGGTSMGRLSDDAPSPEPVDSLRLTAYHVAATARAPNTANTTPVLMKRRGILEHILAEPVIRRCGLPGTSIVCVEVGRS
jgi:hypothetical protein